MKIQNTFSKGIINKDLDSRFVDSAEMIDAENFFVNTLEGSGGGVGKNALGNALKTAYNITGGHTIGHGVNTSENKVYNFIKGTNHDYIIEYDSETFASAIVAQSTTGTRLNFITGERITNVEVISGNTVSDTLLMFSGDSNPPRILNIARFKQKYIDLELALTGSGIDWFTAEEIMLIKAPPLFPPTVVQVNTVDEKENFMKDKYISFATRYKYKDNYYSAISSWQEYAFTPDRFELDMSSCENTGMVNIYNGCDITFNTGLREVVAIDLLFKYSNSSVVYKVDQFIKTEEGWGDNITIPTPIRFTNNKTFAVLPEDQYFRSYDNVPESVVASTIAGNRAMFANYVEGKDLIDKNGAKVVMDYTASYSSVSPESLPLTPSKLSTTSLFDASSIIDGKIRLDFTGKSLKKGGAISILFNIKSIAVIPAIPSRPIAIFENNYISLLDKDYANIASVIIDDGLNGFKSGIQGYLSDLFKNTFLVWPADSLGFPPSVFNGFSVSVVGDNVIDIIFPSMKYEIEVLPSGPNTFVTEYFQESMTTAYVDSIASKRSMKSYRSYEVAVLYRDLQGRKTTALTSTNNTTFIPLSKSTSKNTLTVDMGDTKPPKWATTYKFAIKETIKTYEEIYTTDFYEDGYFRWVRLEGTSKNKVKEGDVLLVKRDVSSVHAKPVTVKVLELKTQSIDFIVGGISEIAGLYMKIKPVGFDMTYDPKSFTEFTKYASSLYNIVPIPNLTISFKNEDNTPTEFPQNSIFTILLKCNYSNEDQFNTYEFPVVASSDYPNFQTFYNAQIANLVFQGDNTTVEFGGVFDKNSPAIDQLYIRGTSKGKYNTFTRKRAFLDVKFTLRTAAGFMIFENTGLEEDSSIYYETPDVFTIVNGEHVSGIHLLTKTFNCFAQGNGAESYQIRDAFNERYLSIDFSPTAVSSDGFKKASRYSDITYSGVYNSNTNINRLNEFNLYLANFKEDIEKSYGPILKIKGTDTNIEVYQEDKCSKVYYGKDLLYNADGSSNLTAIEAVLGQQETYGGEYGISYHPESFDKYAFNSYLTDTKRGVVLKKSNNGLFEISSQGMNSYFKKLFRDNAINQIIGEYDQYHDVYVLNIKYNGNQYVTWVYSDKDNGWLGRITFNPEDMARVNGKFISFKNGEIYQHNESVRNTFYGVEYPSTWTINFSQEPSARKNYKTIEIEGTDAWQVGLLTDIDTGYVNASDFNKEEGVYKAYSRLSNAVIDTSLLSVQGIGNCTVSGLVLSFGYDLSNDISIGDDVRNLSNQLVGTILSKTPNSLTLNAVANIVSGDYVMCSKPQSANVNSLLGYHLQVSGTLTKNTKTELFAVNSEVVKSFN